MKKVAMTLAAALMADAALALNPTSSIDMHIYMSGSSTFDRLLIKSAVQLCDGGTLDVFSDIGPVKPEGSAFSAFACRMSQSKVSTLSVPLINVMIHKRSLGGSTWGVSPVATASNVPQMSISPANCGSSASGSTTISSVSVPVWTCSSSNTLNTLSDAGISAVEPALLGNSPNLVPVSPNYGTVAGDPGTFIIPVNQLGELTVKSLSAITYGIPVTLNLRNALQAAQGKAVGSDNVLDMPSLTKIQIASIMSGNITSWDRKGARSGNR